MAATVADYRTRLSDVLAFRGIFPQVRGRGQLLAQELVRPGDGGMLVAGIEKLVQKVLLVLLTKIGSRRYAPAEGTTFMLDAERGRWRTTADVSESFYAARLDVSRQCRASEAATDPADERWGSLDLDGVTLAGDKVTLRLSLVSAAGTAYSFLTPIPVPIK
jgi:hypothetical protein